MKRDLKIRIWKWIAFVGFSLSLLLGVGVNAQTASELMNSMAEVYKSSGCIDISASVTVKSVVPENNGKSEFTMLLKGKKFKMDTPDMTVWFDGETQWAYLKNSEEVNVSLPNSGELISTNPLALMQSYDTFFEVKGKSETVAFNGKGCYKLQLSPKKEDSIRKMELEIAKDSGLPVAIYVEDKNKTQISIRIGRMKTKQGCNDSDFVFPESEYPDAEIIDLR